MKINEQLAQEIANKVMKVIPYNVNIMDEVGLIIGSGDPNRIGTYHHGAMAAIEQGKLVSIYNSDGAAKPGVNIPIKFRNMTIGVIGLSGEPTIVEPFAELVRVTAELLINQEFLYKERRIKEQIKEEFMYHWIFRTEEYDQAFINSGEAVGINLEMDRIAVVVKGSSLKEPFLLDQEFSFRLSQNTMLFIVPNSSDILKRLEDFISRTDTRIGIGTSHAQIGKSVHEAKKALEIAEKLRLTEYHCYYHDLKFIDYLTNKEIEFEEISGIYHELETSPKGIELIETLISYIENSGDMNAIATELHIHRNSLAYRLQKIETLTNKNPKKFIELFQLFTGYVLYKMNYTPIE
ncbi:CdaR family transcriptional regulator [Neobacillus drentensis]|uniref:CdaR family transcriptional regulator n=1 Tax=Neobacillus drentensis TaxID=220684 RepID=UPI002FFF98E5